MGYKLDFSTFTENLFDMFWPSFVHVNFENRPGLLVHVN